MPADGDNYTCKNLSKEWSYWRNYYECMGLGYNKVRKLTHKKMRKLYNV